MTEATRELKRLSRNQYAKAKQMWASGRYNLAQIGAEMGVSPQALQRRFSRDNIRKGQDAEKHDKAIKENLDNSIISETQEVAKLIAERKRTAMLYQEQLEKRLMFELMKTTKEGLPPAAAHANVKCILDIMKGVSLSYDLASRVMGIERMEDQDKPLPTLQIQEMTADDIEEIRQAQRIAMDEAHAPLIEGDLDQLDDHEDIEIDEDIVDIDSEIDEEFVALPESEPEEDMS